MGHLPSRARIAGILAISLLMLSAPGASAGSFFQPDAQIRQGSNPSYLGVGTINQDGIDQHAFNSGAQGQKLTFFIRIVNLAVPETGADFFKVRRSAGYTDGYRVRYYDAANNDVTGKVSAGTFTTPAMGTNDEYVMRATVKIQSWATACSSTSRLITVTSVSDSTERDAVRFTAARATPDLNCAPVAVNDKASITENQSSVTGNFFANDIDPDGDPITLWDLGSVAGQPVYGSIGFNPSGFYIWYLDNANLAVNALNNGETLTQVLEYSVNDGTLESNTATLTITIHGVTDPD